MHCSASARVGLDTEQLLPAGPALAGGQRGQRHRLCVCVLAWLWAACTACLCVHRRAHPRERLVHTSVLTWRGPLTPTEPISGGPRSQGITVAGGVQPRHRSEHHPGAANHGQHRGPPRGAQATAAIWAEPSSQTAFCKRPRCPLYNLFTGAPGRSRRGVCGEQHAERICLACRFPCPGKELQA